MIIDRRLYNIIDNYHPGVNSEKTHQELLKVITRLDVPNSNYYNSIYLLCVKGRDDVLEPRSLTNLDIKLNKIKNIINKQRGM